MYLPMYSRAMTPSRSRRHEPHLSMGTRNARGSRQATAVQTVNTIRPKPCMKDEREHRAVVLENPSAVDVSKAQSRRSHGEPGEQQRGDRPLGAGSHYSAEQNAHGVGAGHARPERQFQQLQYAQPKLEPPDGRVHVGDGDQETHRLALPLGEQEEIGNNDVPEALGQVSHLARAQGHVAPVPAQNLVEQSHGSRDLFVQTAHVDGPDRDLPILGLVDGLEAVDPPLRRRPRDWVLDVERDAQHVLGLLEAGRLEKPLVVPRLVGQEIAVGTVVALDKKAVLIVLRGAGRPEHLGGAALLKPARRGLEEELRDLRRIDAVEEAEEALDRRRRGGVAPVAVVALVEDRGHAAHYPAGLPIAGEEQFRRRSLAVHVEGVAGLIEEPSLIRSERLDPLRVGAAEETG